MKGRIALAALAALLSGAAPLAADMVFVSVAEDASTAYPGTADLARSVEDGIMAAFFDLDQIASTAPIVPLTKAAFDDYEAELKKAIAGGADYLLLLLVEYKAPEKGAKPVATGVAWRLARMIDSRVLAEGLSPVELPAKGSESSLKPCFDTGTAIVKAVAAKVWKAGIK